MNERLSARQVQEELSAKIEALEARIVALESRPVQVQKVPEVKEAKKPEGITPANFLREEHKTRFCGPVTVNGNGDPVGKHVVDDKAYDVVRVGGSLEYQILNADGSIFKVLTNRYQTF